jgi:hypothetical protein
MHISTDPWIWVGVFLTLCILSFLYKENPFYRFGEHLFVGVSNGWTVAFMWNNVLVPVGIRPIGEAFRIARTDGLSLSLFNPYEEANFILILILMIGCLYFTRFIPGVTWMVRIPIGIFMGYYVGLAVPAYFQGTVLRQVGATVLTPAKFVSTGEGIIGVLVLIGVLCTLVYFFFSKEHKGVLKGLSWVGIVFIMVGFGASFGFTVMARMSLAIGRFTFLLRDWLGLVQ